MPDEGAGGAGLGPERLPPTVLPHNGVVFEDATVYVTGHSYTDCTFRRCTMIYMGGVTVMNACKFDGCVWHLNVLVHDSDDWDEFVTFVMQMVTRTVPRKSKLG